MVTDIYRQTLCLGMANFRNWY